MTQIAFNRDGWIESPLGSLEEDRTFTRLTIKVGTATVTRNFSKRGGGESDAINVPLYPLALAIAESWWPLLYEPIRPSISRKFRAKHRLDVAMHGYVFPALALCSAGADSILVDWRQESSEYSPIEFLTAAPLEPATFKRAQVETVLMDLVAAVFDRLPNSASATGDLRQVWDRVLSSFNRADERTYCIAAGKLGVDPYDPDAPDIALWFNKLSIELANDISDAAEVEELQQIVEWIDDTRSKLKRMPKIEISAFGNPVEDDDLNQPAWKIGYAAANCLRDHIGLNASRPRKAVDQILGGVVRKDHALSTKGPSSITGLIARNGKWAQIGTIAQSARQQRFRACAAAYIAWATGGQERRASTIAHTRLQQASRAFAAELLAPAAILADRAGQLGLTADLVDDAAKEFICPHDTVVLQAFNHGIVLRGIEAPAYRRAFLA